MKNSTLMVLLALACAQNVCAMDRLSAGKQAQKEKMAALQEKRFAKRLVRMQQEQAAQEEAKNVAECKARDEAIRQHNLLNDVLPRVYRASSMAHVERAREQLAALGLVFNDDVCLKTVLTKTLPEYLDWHRGVRFPELVELHEEQAMLDTLDNRLFIRSQNEGQQLDFDAENELIEEGLARGYEWALRFKVGGIPGFITPTAIEQKSCIENALEQEKYMPNLYVAAMFYKLQGLYSGIFGYEQNQNEAQRLVQRGLAHNKDWALFTYIGDLRFGHFGIEHNEAAARELIDTGAAQGHRLVLRAKMEDIISGHYGDDMRSGFVQNCAAVVRELFQNLRNERARIASLADALQK